MKENGKEYINPEISRRILKNAKNDCNNYQSWMRHYINPKDYYKIIKTSLYKYNLDEFSSIFITSFENNGICISKKDFDILLQKTNKLSLILLFIKSIKENTFVLSKKIDPKLLYLIFNLRIKNSSILTSVFKNIDILNFSYNNLFIIAPVCPDYSYTITSEGKYLYTFDGVGNGIGVVANKAISNIKLLKELSSDLERNGFSINYKILIGDFEANKYNLEALGETKESFLNKINQSIITIHERHQIKTDNFTSICNGLNGWKNQILFIKTLCKINKYEDLKVFAPYINHDKNLISRLPLYKKWFGYDKNYKQIFFNQCLEYIAMGYIIKNYYEKNCLILASDHKAMRPYYNLLANINLIASSASY